MPIFSELMHRKLVTVTDVTHFIDFKNLFKLNKICIYLVLEDCNLFHRFGEYSKVTVLCLTSYIIAIFYYLRFRNGCQPSWSVGATLKVGGGGGGSTEAQSGGMATLKIFLN